MSELLLLLSLTAISAISIESRFPFNDFPRRLITIVTVMAAQLFLGIQMLSFAGQLTGATLLLCNLLLTVITFLMVPPWRPHASRHSWRQLCVATASLARSIHCPVTWIMLVIAFASITLHCVIGAFVIPFGDSYHFEMPAFWMQHRTIAPFPTSNPRLVAVSFLAEALCLPGYLYLQTPVLFAVFTYVAALLSVMVVFALARRAGASTAAAAAAAALTAGYPIFMNECRNAHAAAILAGMWFGACLLFLFSCRRSDSVRINLGGAVICFCMACGTKNSTVLLAPVAVMLAMLMLGRSVCSRRAIQSVLVAAMLGLPASGMLWNYGQNQSWFGNIRGPEFLREHLSSDFHPRSMYTRLCRGLVLLAGDTIWIPRSWQSTYSAGGKAAVRWMGGIDVIRDDVPASSSAGLTTGCHFSEESITPRKGLGLAGLFFFLPGLVLAVRRCARDGRTDGYRWNTVGLLSATVGVFLLSHVFLRWQAIGLLRLVPAFLVVGAPLAALALETKTSRLLALATLGVSVAALSVFCLGTAARRLDSRMPLPGWILRLQNSHEQPLRIEWPNRPVESLLVKENYTRREVYERIWRELPQPAVVGLIGDYDSEFYPLFGCGFANRVVSLRDTRSPEALLDPPVELQVIMLADYTETRVAWVLEREYELICRVYDGNFCVLAVFRKRAY